MENKERSPHPYAMTLTEGDTLPKTHPDALGQGEPGKPPGGMPLNPASSRTPAPNPDQEKSSC